jgi:hypothetical protein
MRQLAYQAFLRRPIPHRRRAAQVARAARSLPRARSGAKWAAALAPFSPPGPSRRSKKWRAARASCYARYRRRCRRGGHSWLAGVVLTCRRTHKIAISPPVVRPCRGLEEKLPGRISAWKEPGRDRRLSSGSTRPTGERARDEPEDPGVSTCGARKRNPPARAGDVSPRSSPRIRAVPFGAGRGWYDAGRMYSAPCRCVRAAGLRYDRLGSRERETTAGTRPLHDKPRPTIRTHSTAAPRGWVDWSPAEFSRPAAANFAQAKTAAGIHGQRVVRAVHPESWCAWSAQVLGGRWQAAGNEERGQERSC